MDEQHKAWLRGVWDAVKSRERFGGAYRADGYRVLLRLNDDKLVECEPPSDTWPSTYTGLTQAREWMESHVHPDHNPVVVHFAGLKETHCGS